MLIYFSLVLLLSSLLEQQRKDEYCLFFRIWGMAYGCPVSSGTYNYHGENGFSYIHCNTVNQTNCYFQCRLLNANKTSEATIQSLNMCLLTSNNLGTKERIKGKRNFKEQNIVASKKKKNYGNFNSECSSYLIIFS